MAEASLVSVAFTGAAMLGGLLTVIIVSWHNVGAALLTAPFIGSLFALALAIFISNRGSIGQRSTMGLTLFVLGCELHKQYELLFHGPLSDEISRHLQI